MKVSQIMQRSVTSISPNTPLKEVIRLIFRLSISGIPVVDKGKMIGIVTEADILKKLHPTLGDIIEDRTKATNFELMEKNLKSIMNMCTCDIMTKTFTSISHDEPIMKAQSMMFLNNISRLPVLDDNNKLIGIISQGDIFRELIKNEFPIVEKERYADFVAKYYDKMVDWEKRFDFELPIIFRQFKKLEANTVIDVGSWTGEYSINLVKEGMKKVLAIDHNKSMIELSKKKLRRLTKKQTEKIEFRLTDFKNLEEISKERYDVAICMGNSLPYVPVIFPDFLTQLKKVLRRENGAIILQVLNQEKLLKKEDRVLSLQIQKSKEGGLENLFLEFFDTTEDPLRVIHHLVIFEKADKEWLFKGITSIPIFYYTHEYLEKQLKEHGFKRIIIAGNQGEYQGEYGQLSFHEPFDPEKSDWINIVAVRR